MQLTKMVRLVFFWRMAGRFFQVFAVAESDDGIAFFQDGPVVGAWIWTPSLTMSR